MMIDGSLPGGAGQAGAARCGHFGVCGGCHSQDVGYDEQLRRKGSALEALFQSFWRDPIPVTPSPRIWRYRNRLDFNFGRKHYDTPPPKGFVRESVLGFRRRGRWYWPVDIQDCLIGPEKVSALLEAVRVWMRAEGLEAYDARSRQGALRALLVREGIRTGQRMVVLITGEGLADPERFVAAARSVYPADSIYQGVYRGRSDVVTAEELTVMYGTPTIEEELRIPDDAGELAFRLRLSPFSFFQTNTLAAERLYGTIRAWVGHVGPTTLYDLYGGSGGIALSCADLAERVISVESVESATHDGTHNAKMNGVSNVVFSTFKVEDYLRSVAVADGIEPGAAWILDPPRAGLHPKVVRALVELAPGNVLYVSCKPSVLAEELKALTATYTVKAMWAVDLFPHTPHVEVVAWLQVNGG